MRVFEIIKGEIQGFELPSKLYGTTMTGAIEVKDAIERGFVAMGDGDSYTFTSEEIDYLTDYMEYGEGLTGFTFLGVTNDTKISAIKDIDVEDYELTPHTRSLLRRSNLPQGEVYVADFLKLESITKKVMYELIENSIVTRVKEPIKVKDIVRKVRFNSDIVLNKIPCRIECVKDHHGDRIPDMARFIEYREANNVFGKIINSVKEGDLEEIEESVYLVTERKIKIIY